jgi:hypothetical protein
MVMLIMVKMVMVRECDRIYRLDGRTRLRYELGGYGRRDTWRNSQEGEARLETSERKRLSRNTLGVTS